MYVGSIPFKWTETDIQHEFSEYGEILEVNIPTSKQGICFLTFANPECAGRCIEKRNGTDIEGRAIKVSRAVRKQGGQGNKGGGYDRGGGRDGFVSPRAYNGGYASRGAGGPGSDRWDPRESEQYRDDFPQRDDRYKNRDNDRDRRDSNRAYEDRRDVRRDDRRQGYDRVDEPRRDQRERHAPNQNSRDTQITEENKKKLKQLSQQMTALEQQLSQLSQAAIQHKKRTSQARIQKEASLADQKRYYKEEQEYTARAAALQERSHKTQKEIEECQNEAEKWRSSYEARRQELEALAQLTEELFASKAAFEQSKAACEKLTLERANCFAKFQYALNAHSNPQQEDAAKDAPIDQVGVNQAEGCAHSDGSRQPVSFSMFGTLKPKK